MNNIITSHSTLAETSTSVTLICCAKTFKTIHEAQKPK